MRNLSVEANKAASQSGPPQTRHHQQQQQHQAHAHPQQGRQQQQQQQARAEQDGAPAGPEGGPRRAGPSRDSQPKAVPIATAPREPSSRREAPGEQLVMTFNIACPPLKQAASASMPEKRLASRAGYPVVRTCLYHADSGRRI